MPDLDARTSSRASGGSHVAASPACWWDAGHAVSPLYLPDLHAVRAAREFVHEQLSEAGLQACALDASLLVCELAANAVLHARTRFTLHLRPTLEGGVRVEVHDESPLPPVLTAPSLTAMSGRGLNLVESMAIRWGSHPVMPPAHHAPSPSKRTPLDQLGKIVWFEVDAGAPVVDDAGIEELLTRWDNAGDAAPAPRSALRHPGTVVSAPPAADDLRTVVIPDLPVLELLVAKEAMDDLLRELQLLTLDHAGPSHASHDQRREATDEELAVAAEVDAAARDFEPARRQIRGQVNRAAARGEVDVTLALLLPPGAWQSAVRFRDAVLAAERLDPSRHLATVREDLGWHTDVRHHYLSEIVRQLSS